MINITLRFTLPSLLILLLSYISPVFLFTFISQLCLYIERERERERERHRTGYLFETIFLIFMHRLLENTFLRLFVPVSFEVISLLQSKFLLHLFLFLLSFNQQKPLFNRIFLRGFLTYYYIGMVF